MVYIPYLAFQFFRLCCNVCPKTIHNNQCNKKFSFFVKFASLYDMVNMISKSALN